MERNFSIKCEFNVMEIPSFHIKEVELDACYMALNNLRNLLFQEPMLELLQYQIEEGTSYFESLIAESNDAYTESMIQLTVYGLSAREFRSLVRIPASRLDGTQVCVPNTPRQLFSYA